MLVEAEEVPPPRYAPLEEDVAGSDPVVRGRQMVEPLERFPTAGRDRPVANLQHPPGTRELATIEGCCYRANTVPQAKASTPRSARVRSNLSCR